MLQRRVYHSMAAVQRKLYVLGGNDLDYNNDRILVRHIDSYNIDTDQWTRCNFNLLTGQNESGVAVHNERIYLVGGYSIWTNEPLACIQVLDVSREGKEEVFYGPTLPFASNGIAACFLPAPYFTCPNLQTLQVPHHRIGTIWKANALLITIMNRRGEKKKRSDFWILGMKILSASLLFSRPFIQINTSKKWTVF